jgi:hypothetical protein
MKPSDDPKADELRNANLNHPEEEGNTPEVASDTGLMDLPMNELMST